MAEQGIAFSGDAQLSPALATAILAVGFDDGRAILYHWVI